ncbi:helix-turn-helix domain-containing protein [Streptomyces sp. NPDC101237]|uniref:helix-turn-helix domain-containing protein n=1 Tax=Streptomyces sp. NPDC101237 TaxID=3366139 RepID=UPI00381E92CA
MATTGRPEKPVDRTVPARAKLADFLRARKAAAGLTYEEMAKNVGGMPSKATFERAASGISVPSWESIETAINVTITKQEKFTDSIALAHAQGLDLFIRARRATRAPYHLHKAPDPELINTIASFGQALRDQHVWAGHPTPGEMTRTSTPGTLPATTVRHIINGKILPVDAEQAIAFLKACYIIEPADLELWIAGGGGGIRALRNSRQAEKKNILGWERAHWKLRQQLRASARPQPSEDRDIQPTTESTVLPDPISQRKRAA